MEQLNVFKEVFPKLLTHLSPVHIHTTNYYHHHHHHHHHITSPDIAIMPRKGPKPHLKPKITPPAEADLAARKPNRVGPMHNRKAEAEAKSSSHEQYLRDREVDAAVAAREAVKEAKRLRREKLEAEREKAAEARRGAKAS